MTGSSSSPKTSYKAVSFGGDVTILQFPIVLGNNPAVSSGCPIELGWDRLKKETQDFELFEYMRQSERKSDRRRLVIPVSDRAKLLMKNGYTIEDIAGAVMLVEELQRQRAESCKETAGEAFMGLVGKTGKLPMNMVRGVLRLGGLGNSNTTTTNGNTTAATSSPKKSSKTARSA